MRYLADENVEKPIVDWLRERGNDVYYVPEVAPSLKDQEIIQIAKRENRVLVTNDKDFGELVFRQGKVASGIILIRATNERSRNKLRLVKQVIDETKGGLRGKFIVVNETGMRIRDIPYTNKR